jgi:tRNA (cytidine/uridine-2'-O-)-methyltransferase
MFHVVLFEPEIPPNTGNIIRLCANTGAQLHIVHPAAFKLDDSKLRRAGLDYHEYATVREWTDLNQFFAATTPQRVFAFSTKGQRGYAKERFTAGDVFLFGPESRGLPATVLQALPPGHVLRIPMRAGNRSLNLSNAVAVVVYEAWRQLGFDGASVQ